jgi:hypothetical protein
MDNNKRKNIKRTVWVLLTLAIISLCLCPFLYFLILPEIDLHYCVRDFDKRMDIRDGNGSSDDIRRYIKTYISTSIAVGMSQQEVIEILEKLGPLEVRKISLFEDYLILKICRHPYNGFKIIADYKIDGTLKSILLESHIANE